jgi:hypothetical protein
MKSVLYSFQNVLFFLLAFSAATNIEAQTATLSVQGVLTRSDGTAVDDGNDYVLTFRLWKSETSTAPADKVHEETISNISIVGGVYSVVLGDDTPLTAPFDQTYWLGVSVNTSSIELLPRPRLTHAPYSLGIVGQNNKFPSTGTVIADAINIAGNANATAFKAVGGPPVGPNASNGYSFGAGGDFDGGLFSDGDNNVALYANAAKALEATSAGVSIPGTLTVSGATSTGTHTVIGWQEVNGFQTINSNQIVNGFSTVTANQTVDGIVRAGGGIVNKTFTNSGMYWSSGNHDIFINVKGANRALFGDNGVNYFWGPTVFYNGDFNVQGIPFGDHRTMQYDNATGKFYWDNSSRRYKENITAFNDNFSLILKSQPKTYTRPGNPNRWEIGYIAEEMDSIGLKSLMELNSVTGEIEGFNYEKMIVYVVEVLKMQDDAITQLQTEVAQLKAENTGLTNLNKTLKTDNTVLEQQQEEINKQLAGLLKRIQALEASSTGK